MPEFDVVDLGPADAPESGDEAHAFTRPLVTAEYWEDRSLADVLGEGRAILAFTPMVGSFLARYVWDELHERGWDEFDERVVGISASTPYGISRFLDENGYAFDCFADPSNGVAEAYGLAHDLDGMTGVAEPRIAFLAVGPDRTVEAAWVAREWPEFPEYDALEERLGLA